MKISKLSCWFLCGQFLILPWVSLLIWPVSVTQWLTRRHFTKYIAKISDEMGKLGMKKSRTSVVIMTNEARVLRKLRIEHGLSMDAVARHIGCTNSYISHIETGRTAVPSGDRLEALLDLYGGISSKYFAQLAKDFEAEYGDLEIIIELAPKLRPVHLKSVRNLIELYMKESK